MLFQMSKVNLLEVDEKFRHGSFQMVNQLKLPFYLSKKNLSFLLPFSSIDILKDKVNDAFNSEVCIGNCLAKISEEKLSLDFFTFQIWLLIWHLHWNRLLLLILSLFFLLNWQFKFILSKFHFCTEITVYHNEKEGEIFQRLKRVFVLNTSK